MIAPTRPLRVRVPGSTSNLGPGYDVLGLALDRFLEVVWEPGDHPLVVEGHGTLAGLDPARDLVSGSLARALASTRDHPGGRLRVESAIPVARGLGSSAAARVAGGLLALMVRREASGSPSEPDPQAVHGPAGPVPVSGGERAALIEEAARAEGHPDNAVPSLVGGFVAASLDADGVRWTPLPLSPSVGMVFAAPPVEIRTADARRVLPDALPHRDAAANGARLATLLAGLARADGDRIAWGLVDRLHVPWRWGLVPGADQAAARAREAGAWGVTLSGSGSGVMAFCPRARRDEVATALADAFAAVRGPGGRWAFPVERALLGAAVVSDGPAVG